MTPLPPWVKRFPCEDLKGNTEATLLVKSTTARRRYAIRCSTIAALHRCVGTVPGANPVKDKPTYATVYATLSGRVAERSVVPNDKDCWRLDQLKAQFLGLADMSRVAVHLTTRTRLEQEAIARYQDWRRLKKAKTCGRGR